MASVAGTGMGEGSKQRRLGGRWQTGGRPRHASLTTSVPQTGHRSYNDFIWSACLPGLPSIRLSLLWMLMCHGPALLQCGPAPLFLVFPPFRQAAGVATSGGRRPPGSALQHGNQNISFSTKRFTKNIQTSTSTRFMYYYKLCVFCSGALLLQFRPGRDRWRDPTEGVLRLS